MLYMAGLQKGYPGVAALQWPHDMSVSVSSGEIHGIVGENGAGKSTLLSIIAGIQKLDRGVLRLADEDYAPESVSAARSSGIEIVTQELGLVASLSVTDNFFLGRARAVSYLPGRISRHATVRKALSTIIPDVSPKATAGSLTLQDQKLVELARAVHFSSRVLLIDEISASLDKSGIERLYATLRAEKARGRTILFISHYLEEIEELCDRVSVLRDGLLVATLRIEDVDAQKLTTSMVGRAISNLYPEKLSNQHTEAVLQASNLTVAGEFENVSFSVSRGEILGIGGLVGCGSASLARTVFGQTKPSAGLMTLLGRAYAPRGPRNAIARRVAYVPSDREREGLLLRESIWANITIAMLPTLSRFGIHLKRSCARRASGLVRQIGIKCRNVDDLPLHLSGGNRQKIVISKWLLGPIDLFILHNPTRGVDVGAKAELYKLISRLASRGAAIILVSDELPELIGLSNRILLMRRGRISFETRQNRQVTEHELIEHMV